jgi:hypothetical protein
MASTPQRGSRSGLDSWVIPAVAVLLVLVAVLVFVMPFVLVGNASAQIFAGIVLTILSTLASVICTYFYSRQQHQDELTRYGIQAWRSLDALAIKLSQHVGDDTWDSDTLRGWLLDVDGAKWAWRDLLREVFELQSRLEEEKDEIATKFRQQIEQADSPSARMQLETEQSRALRQLAARAPLPMSLPEEADCPNCGTHLAADLGTASGDTRWVTCGNCDCRFAIHRQADGTVKIGAAARWRVFSEACPSCGDDVKLSVPEGRHVEFATKCNGCGHHLQFSGLSQDHEFVDLGTDNISFVCPACSGEVTAWISPRGVASFKTPCPRCNGMLTISGSPERFEVTR